MEKKENPVKDRWNGNATHICSNCESWKRLIHNDLMRRFKKSPKMEAKCTNEKGDFFNSKTPWNLYGCNRFSMGEPAMGGSFYYQLCCPWDDIVR